VQIETLAAKTFVVAVGPAMNADVLSECSANRVDEKMTVFVKAILSIFDEPNQLATIRKVVIEAAQHN
jgi:hypothetical protein